jgi:hypothetical protein
MIRSNRRNRLKSNRKSIRKSNRKRKTKSKNRVRRFNNKIKKDGRINPKILCLTFNQGEADDKNEEIITKFNNLISVINPDIIILSLQECKSPIILDYMKSKYMEIIRKTLPQPINDKTLYLGIYSNNIDISILSSSHNYCSYINITKGTIYAKLKVQNKILHVFSAHLPHKPDDFLSRNKCIEDSIKSKNISEGESVIYMGDLNYRTNIENPSKNSIISCKLSDKNKDQLKNNHILNKVNLKESPIEFCQTCRFLEGTSDYDSKRFPSWCDRILYRNMTTSADYNSIRLTETSDHNAVYNIFQF